MHELKRRNVYVTFSNRADIKHFCRQVTIHIVVIHVNKRWKSWWNRSVRSLYQSGSFRLLCHREHVMSSPLINFQRTGTIHSDRTKLAIRRRNSFQLYSRRSTGTCIRLTVIARRHIFLYIHTTNWQSTPYWYYLFHPCPYDCKEELLWRNFNYFSTHTDGKNEINLRPWEKFILHKTLRPILKLLEL